MAATKRIGLLFDDVGHYWTGGEYYLLNIIRSLNYLSASEVELVVFYSDAVALNKIKDLNYNGKLLFLPINKPVNLWPRIINKLTSIVFKKDPQFGSIYNARTVQFIYPLRSVEQGNHKSLSKLQKVYWIPDFQHKYLPHFFSSIEIEERDRNFTQLSKMDITIVLSSESAKDNFLEFYPENNARVKVLPFASVLPDFSTVQFEDLIGKYGIGVRPYFIVPNQFWMHKNHITVLRAVKHLVEIGQSILVLFTGKELDYRNIGYVEELKKFVSDHGLENYISFLGFIDRAEQLQLINHSLAVIQPSLFEGWSTVVEDAKALNRNLILSDLKVHREQCQEQALFFEPNSTDQLATQMLYLIKSGKECVKIDYIKQIKDFAHRIVAIEE